MNKNRFLNILVVAVLLFSGVIAAPVAAKPGHVLYVKPGAGGDCSSWAEACDLQTALGQAVAGMEIWVAAGVYYPGASQADSFHLKNGVALYGGFAGDEHLLKQRNWTANLTTLSGDLDQNGILDSGNAQHVVAGEYLDASAVLDGFTITGGNASEYVFPIVGGGGMYNDHSHPTLSNLIFTGNSAYERGGGMYNTGSNPTLTNVTFSDNSAYFGGGLYDYYSCSTLTNVTFTGNSAISDGGGMLTGYCDSTLVNVIFIGNSAGNGGGMGSGYNSPTLTNVLFLNNFAAHNGGGMYTETSSPTLTNVTLSNNVAGGYGGGFWNYRNSATVMNNTILWGNTGRFGNQIYNWADSTMTVAYSLIQGGWPGEGNLDADPLFVDAASGDLHLGPGSPAIDAANNFAVPAGVTTDLDGSRRFVNYPGGKDPGLGQGRIVDMGAYEAHRGESRP